MLAHCQYGRVMKVDDLDVNLVSSNHVAVPMWANYFIFQCLGFLFSKMWAVAISLLSDYYKGSVK